MFFRREIRDKSAMQVYPFRNWMHSSELRGGDRRNSKDTSAATPGLRFAPFRFDRVLTCGMVSPLATCRSTCETDGSGILSGECLLEFPYPPSVLKINRRAGCSIALLNIVLIIGICTRRH
jgi:hypothetical protein